jgi:hypothetical protein
LTSCLVLEIPQFQTGCMLRDHTVNYVHCVCLARPKVISSFLPRLLFVSFIVWFWCRDLHKRRWAASGLVHPTVKGRPNPLQTRCFTPLNYYGLVMSSHIFIHICRCFTPQQQKWSMKQFICSGNHNIIYENWKVQFSRFRLFVCACVVPISTSMCLDRFGHIMLCDCFRTSLFPPKCV